MAERRVGSVGEEWKWVGVNRKSRDQEFRLGEEGEVVVVVLVLALEYRLRISRIRF